MLKRISFYLIPVLLALIIGLVAVLSNNQSVLHLELIAYHSPFFDGFFKYFTEIGHGITAVIIIIVVSVLQWRNFLPVFLIGISSFVISGLLAQFFKRLIFSDVVRPKKLIGSENLHLIDGIKLNEYFSFPSGHATTTFAIFTFLALVFPRQKLLHLGFALVALFGAYSRVYTSQHWLEDILAGGVIGIGISLLVYAIFQRYTFKSYFLGVGR